MAKWHAFGRCKTRLSKSIGKFNSAKIQQEMTGHTLSVARSLEKKELIDISLATSGIGFNKSRKWCNELGIKNFNLQGRGSLGERMKRQIIINKKLCFKRKFRNIIIIGTDLPDLCHVDLLSAIEELKTNELIFGPSNDGGYWLIGFSKKLFSSTNFYLPFINIKWSRSDVLQKTIDNFSTMSLKYKFLRTKMDIDTITDIEKRNELNCQNSQ